MQKLVTAGELARLAGTSKRTILWYDQKGIIKPKTVLANGYRFYEESQVLEYQKVLLLNTLGIKLQEIKKYLTHKGDLNKLFKEKKKEIKEQIDNLRFNLNSLEKFELNLEKSKTMIEPVIKIMKPFAVYYIEKICSYIEIGRNCEELSSMFSKKGAKFTTLAIFEDSTYQPKKSRIKIGALKKPGMKVKDEYKEKVKEFVFNPGKVITYTHNGSGTLLSLFWKELEKYCRLNKFKVRYDTSDFEIYRKVSRDPGKQFFEIYLPIK